MYLVIQAINKKRQDDFNSGQHSNILINMIHFEMPRFHVARIDEQSDHHDIMSGDLQIIY